MSLEGLAKGKKPQRSEFATKEEYQNARSVWQAKLVAQHATTPPEEMSQRAVVAYLAHHQVVSTGPRMLLNWRISRLRQQLPVVRSPRMNPVLPLDQIVFVRIDAGNAPFFVCGNANVSASLLHIPADVVERHILCWLGDEDLLSFMRVSRLFYVRCWNLLAERASLLLHRDATPLALSCYYYYWRLLEKRDHNDDVEPALAAAKRRKSTKELTRKNEVARVLHVNQQMIKRTYVQPNELAMLIAESIAINGAIDALRSIPAHTARQAEALDVEREFIASQNANRIAEINSNFTRQGLQAFRIAPHPSTARRYVWLHAAAKYAIALVLGTKSKTSIKRAFNAYVNMQTDTMPFIGAAGEPVTHMLCVALETLATHAIRPPLTSEHYLFSHILLQEFKGPDPITFYGTPLTAAEWRAAVSAFFEPEFLNQRWPAQGNILVLWNSDRTLANIVQLFHQHPQAIFPSQINQMLVAFCESHKEHTYRFGRPSHTTGNTRSNLFVAEKCLILQALKY
jgi:hypothetical protein